MNRLLVWVWSVFVVTHLKRAFWDIGHGGWHNFKSCWQNLGQATWLDDFDIIEAKRNNRQINACRQLGTILINGYICTCNNRSALHETDGRTGVEEVAQKR